MSSNKPDEQKEEGVMNDIRAVLHQIEVPGDFATGGVVQGVYTPHLYVDNSPFPVPLTDSNATELKKNCSQAPFGRGEKTLYDITVRNSLQLEPSQFSLRNPQWLEQVEKIKNQAAKALGCREPGAVYANLYKLLLYERGGCFKVHRDSEKEPGMFATLVILLPSIFEGGRLVARHGNEERSFDFASASHNSAHYIAFFCDVEHEIEEVTSGYRLCLVYNMVLHASVDPPVPIAQPSLETQLMKTLQRWSESTVGATKPNFVVIPLDHKYTEKHLSFTHLKGKDQVIGGLFQRVAGECDIILSVVTLDHVCTEDYTEEEEEGEEGEGAEKYVKHRWSAISSSVTNDTTKDLPWESRRFTIDLSELTNPHIFKDARPDSQSEQTTGNESVSRSLSYYKTALVVAPRTRLLQLGRKFELDKKLQSYIKMDKATRENDPAWKHFCRSVQVVISLKSNFELTKKMIALDDYDSFRAFLSTSQWIWRNPGFVEVVVAAIAHWNWKTVKPLLLTAINTQFEIDKVSTLDLLKNIATNCTTNEARAFYHSYVADTIASLPHPTDANPDKTICECFVELLPFVKDTHPANEDVFEGILACAAAHSSKHQQVEVISWIGDEMLTYGKASPTVKRILADVVTIEPNIKLLKICLQFELSDAVVVPLVINLSTLLEDMQSVAESIRMLRAARVQCFTDSRLKPLFDTITNIPLRELENKGYLHANHRDLLLFFALATNNGALFEKAYKKEINFHYDRVQLLHENIDCFLDPIKSGFSQLESVRKSPNFVELLKLFIETLLKCSPSPDNAWGTLLSAIAVTEDASVAANLFASIKHKQVDMSKLRQVYQHLHQNTFIQPYLYVLRPFFDMA